MANCYFLSLNEEGKERYLRKLTSVGLADTDDPYSPESSSKFVDDMSKWPKIEYGNIFAYFITKPGIYTQEQLLSWKQMDAFNYFQSGHVRTVLLREFGSGENRCVVLKAKVNPSQKAPDKAHESWIIAKPDGRIISAHCTCMAGLGEGCSHVAAILFKVEYAVKMGYTAVTSQSCKWNESYCRKIEPSTIAKIDFRRPKRETTSSDATHRSSKKTVPLPPPNSEDMFFTGLRKIKPDAVIFTSLGPISNTDSCTTTCSSIRKLPPLLTSLKNRKYKSMSKEELNTACNEIFGNLRVSKDEANYLEESTRLQAESLLWYEHRTGRITASVFGSVVRTSILSPSITLVNKILQKSKPVKVPSLQLGISNESTARKAYIELVQEQHENYELNLCGLHINPAYPHLGATPDGLISCDCCGKGVVEIKCPFKHRNVHPHNVEDRSFCLKRSERGVELSSNHDYYYQVQGQMAICDAEYCDFVCWTLGGLHVERILYNPQHFEETKAMLDIFFQKVILPCLLTDTIVTNSDEPNEGNSVEPNSTQNMRTYCWCDGEDVGRMVCCDNSLCPREWFHYKCVENL